MIDAVVLFSCTRSSVGFLNFSVIFQARKTCVGHVKDSVTNMAYSLNSLTLTRPLDHVP